MSSENRDCYLYVHYRNDTNQPFYVGIGRRRRAWDTNATGRNKHWLHIYRKHGRRVEIWEENMTEGEAKSREIATIAFLRYAYGDGIVNISDGGDVMVCGSENPAYDYREHVFGNDETEEIFIGPRLALSTKYDLDRKYVDRTILGQSKSTGGWRYLGEVDQITGVDYLGKLREERDAPKYWDLPEVKAALSKRSSWENSAIADRTIYAFYHKDGGIERETQFGMRKHIIDVGISKLVLGRDKSYGGWVYVGKSDDYQTDESLVLAGEYKQKLAGPLKGRSHKFYDHTVRVFAHPTHGVIKCTQNDLTKTYGVCATKASSLVKRKTTRAGLFVYIGKEADLVNADIQEVANVLLSGINVHKLENTRYVIVSTSGEVKTGTRVELCSSTGLDRVQIKNVVRTNAITKKTSGNGWASVGIEGVVTDEEIAAAVKNMTSVRKSKPKSFVRMHHPVHGYFEGSQAELVRIYGLQSSNTSLVANGKQLEHKGWRLAEIYKEAA